MSDSFGRVILAVLLIMRLLPFFVTHRVVCGFHYLDKEERSTVVKWSIPINLAANVFIGIIIQLAVFRGHASLSQLIAANCAYQDFNRQVLCNIICTVAAAVIGYVGVGIYFRGDLEDLHLNRAEQGRLFVILSAALIPALFGMTFAAQAHEQLKITEFCRKMVQVEVNSNSGEEEEKNISFIVLTNQSSAFSLDEMELYLSEDDRALKGNRVRIRGLGPEESVTLYLNEDESLNIKKNGGSYVFLSDSDGELLDSVELPALMQDEVCRLGEDGWEIYSLAAEEEIVEIASPEFSASAGFYQNEFDLELFSAPGTTIYYTLDGSDPTVDSIKYEGPIHVYDKSAEPNVYRSIENVRRNYLGFNPPSATPVDKCFVVRAVCADSDGNISRSATQSYFINKPKYENRLVISMVSDPKGLFDPVEGICVTGEAYDKWYLEMLRKYHVIDPTAVFPEENYMKHGLDWERPAQIEVFDNTTPILTQDVGIRVQGNAQRYGMAQKRFSIYSRKQYSGSSYFDAKIINDFSQHSLVTRPGDYFAISHYLCTNRNVATQDFAKATLFMDGEYWYSAYLYEKFNEKNMASKYGLNETNIVIVRNGEVPKEAQYGSNPFSNIYTYIMRNDLSDDEKYNEFDQIMDIQSFIDMACINSYLCNMDYLENWNNLMWHTAVKENDSLGDTRWRWGLCDMDLVWTVVPEELKGIPTYQINPFTQVGVWQPTPITEWPIYAALRKSETFCKQFVLTYMDLINDTFTVEKAFGAMETLEIKNSLMTDFFPNRPEYIMQYLAEEFELEGDVENVILTANRADAQLQLNTIVPELREVPEGETIEQPYGWGGRYFTDYPITVSNDQPDFVRWEITSDGRTRTYTDRTIEVPVVKGGVEIHAVFE